MTFCKAIISKVSFCKQNVSLTTKACARSKKKLKMEGGGGNTK